MDTTRHVNQVGTRIVLNVPQGSFILRRAPIDPQDPLQAWDAADELIVKYLYDPFIQHYFKNTPHPPPKQAHKILLINDQWGSLYTIMRTHYPQALFYTWFDDALSAIALTINQQANQNRLANQQVQDVPKILSSTTRLKIINTEDHLGLDQLSTHDLFDLVLIKHPKSHDRLAYQLQELCTHLHTESYILAADMSKYLHKNILKVYQQYWHKVETSLAIKKARLISLTDLKPPHTNIHSSFKSYPVQLAGKTLMLNNFIGTFACGKFDQGAQAIMPYIPNDLGSKTMIDLACGDGILGLIALLKNPQIQMKFMDVSYLAIHSLKHTLKSWQQKGILSASAQIEISCQDCLTGVAVASVDYIIINPPFHSQRAHSQAIAWRMFTQAYQVLKKGGQMLIVGNRHLQYHRLLKKIFGQYTQKGGNHKFVVLYVCKS
jgi:23S rRNA (guanine1835-N2)-methyltransferase